MKEIECPACGEMIPFDSMYCDMCGVELLECVNCNTLGTDPFCGECGKPMIARKPDKIDSAEGENGDKTIGRHAKSILLKSRQGNIILRPEDEAIIGRADSPYAGVLANLNLISRKHGKFVKRGHDWFIVDFGSTNGTYVNDNEVPANSSVQFKAGDKVDIGTYIFDVIEE